MSQTTINESSYPNCIKYNEIDFTHGCEVGCLYCGLAKSKEMITELEIDSILPLIKDIKKGIYLSPNSDAFSPLAAEKTHEILSVALPLGKQVKINTKCIIPHKTVDLIAKYPELCTIQISIARLNQEITDFLEPNSASTEERLANIRLMSKKGIYVNGLIMPLFPGIDDNHKELSELVTRLIDAGVKSIKAAYVILKFGDDEKSLKMINRIKSNPLVEVSLNNMTEHIKAHIGEGNIVNINTRLKTYKFIKDFCDTHNTKFLACSVLDPILLNTSNLPCTVCSGVLHYRT
jgi:DNA repair photolyase